MRMKKWQHCAWIVCLAMAHTVRAAAADDEHVDVDIDQMRYFCGTRLGDMLSNYCSTYFTKRTRRDVARVCCNGWGCSIRYAITNYCQEVKPEYKHLFTTERKDASKGSQTIVRILPADHPKPEPTQDNLSKIINAIRKSVQYAPPSALNKTEATRPSSTQAVTTEPPLSGSFIGTDHIPRGNPVHSTTRWNFFP